MSDDRPEFPMFKLLDKFRSEIQGIREEVKVGTRGPEGPAGDAGPTGPTGPAGPEGPRGLDGKDGVLGSDGRDGKDGVDGEDGEDGRGIREISQAADGDLVFEMTDGTEEYIELPFGLTNNNGSTQLLVQHNGGSGNGGTDDSLDKLPPLSVEADPDTIALRDANADTAFRRVTMSQFLWSGTTSNRNEDDRFFSGNSTVNNRMYTNTATGMRSSLDIYSKSEVDTLVGQTPSNPGDLISTDANNIIVEGTDGKLFAEAPPNSGSIELKWLYLSGTTAPSVNYFRMNSTDPSAVTELYLNKTSYPNSSVGNILSLLTTGYMIYLQQQDNQDSFINFTVTGDVIDNGDYVTVPVEAFDNGTLFTVNTFVGMLFYQGSQQGGGGVTPDGSVANAKGAALALEQSLLANDGQPALTVLAVGATNTDRVQGVSLGDGNVIEVYASGADFNAGNVLYREFMSAGEPICFTGVSDGAIITSTQGFYGCSEQIQGSNESPMPLLSLGLAFTGTFLYAFRSSNNYPGEGNNTGQITVVNGPLPSTVTFTKNGNQVQDQEPRNLEPFELTRFYTDENGEYFLSGTSAIMACMQASMGSTPGSASARFYDARLVMPLTNDGMTWPRSGFVSAPYDNTTSKYYVRDGATGDFPPVSPGTPVDFDNSFGTGANDQDYEPNGATRLRANGLVVAYSGADSAGLEASPMIPVSALSQVVAQPFFIDDSGDGGNSGVAIASPYEGTAKYYAWNDATGKAELAYTIPLTRGSNGVGITPSTPEEQYFPCSGLIANESTLAADPSVQQLTGALAAGYIVADVPITVVSQNSLPTYTPTVRSQNGATTTALVSDDDETLQLGWTPAQLKAEITTDTDGFTRKRVVDNTGVPTYPLT